MELKEKRFQKFDVNEFVRNLMEEGSKVPCDDSVESSTDRDNLPSFYDEKLFKRGQTFFHENIFVLLYSKFLGLLAILAIPSIVSKLIYTKMSGSNMTAYRRYMSTIFHMMIWYEDDFIPGSKLWQSLMEVKNKHNSASKRCNSSGLGKISQKDMALTQFGFMGLAIAKREKIGLYYAQDNDLKCFIHLWKVIGFIMGIDERFNICRDSVEETTAVCKALSDNVFKPAVNNKDKNFISMAGYLINGMWSLNPVFEKDVYLNLLHRVLGNSDDSTNNNYGDEEYIPLNVFKKLLLQFYLLIIWSTKFSIFKIYHNYMQFITLWIMKVFPFLAYYQFGYANSHVSLLSKK